VTLSRQQIHELLEAEGLRPSRSLGQNFVADPNTVRRIARLAEVGPGDRVIEIGAGLGSLTLALAETGADVTTVEIDRHLLSALRSIVEPRGVRIVTADALTIDWVDLLESKSRSKDKGGPWVLVANLPYNVAVPVLMRVLERAPAINRGLVMVQREVGERLAARVGDKAYGAVSVKVAFYARTKVIGHVPSSVFVPRPRVESVLVRFERGENAASSAVEQGVVTRERLFEVITAGFGQRRKMLRRSLSGVVPQEAFEAAGVSAASRAEELSLEEWAKLAAFGVSPNVVTQTAKTDDRRT